MKFSWLTSLVTRCHDARAQRPRIVALEFVHISSIFIVEV